MLTQIYVAMWRHYAKMAHPRVWPCRFQKYGSQYLCGLFRWNWDNYYIKPCGWYFVTLRPRQNGRRFADDTFNCIFLNENVRNSIQISLKFVPQGPINNNSALVQIMAWRRSGDKPLSEPMMVSLPTHICVTRPQWVNIFDGIMLLTRGHSYKSTRFTSNTRWFE